MASLTSTMRIALNEDIREKAKRNAEMIGFSLPSLVKAFVAKFANDGIVPFEIDSRPEPNAETQEAMRELQAGKGTRCRNLDQMYRSMGIEK